MSLFPAKASWMSAIVASSTVNWSPLMESELRSRRAINNEEERESEGLLLLLAIVAA